MKEYYVSHQIWYKFRLIYLFLNIELQGVSFSCYERCDMTSYTESDMQKNAQLFYFPRIWVLRAVFVLFRTGKCNDLQWSAKSVGGESRGHHYRNIE